MYQQRNRARVRVASVSGWTNKLIYLFFLFFSMLLLTLTGINRAHAGNHCCMLDGLKVVSGEAIVAMGQRSVSIASNREKARHAWENGDKHLARRLWRNMALNGDAESAFRLGMIYDTANGVASDPKKAVSWYRRAAMHGNKHAQHNLAVAYANGEGVELNVAEAIRWWNIAARQGNSDSQYNLGIIYAMGSHGIKRNLDMAKRWWRKAAINGDALAQYNLGTLYANGDGQVRSYCEATRWWEKSATAGVKQASWALEVIKTHKEYRSCW